jgi:Tfp pilus assembly protein PilO
MSEPIYLLTIFMPLATVFLIFGMRFIVAIKKAKLQAEGEEAYRQIAQRAVAAQEQTAAALADLQTRLASIEKVLKEVE